MIKLERKKLRVLVKKPLGLPWTYVNFGEE